MDIPERRKLILYSDAACATGRYAVTTELGQPLEYGAIPATLIKEIRHGMVQGSKSWAQVECETAAAIMAIRLGLTIQKRREELQHLILRVDNESLLAEDGKYGIMLRNELVGTSMFLTVEWVAGIENPADYYTREVHDNLQPFWLEDIVGEIECES